LLEPNNIVSKITGKGWPASQADAVWPEQLTAVNGTAVDNVLQVNALLADNGKAPLQLEFVQRNDTLNDMPVGDFYFTVCHSISGGAGFSGYRAVGLPIARRTARQPGAAGLCLGGQRDHYHLLRYEYHAPHSADVGHEPAGGDLCAHKFEI